VSRPRLAVVLFNLGGPDDQATVRPFLFNLFNDKAIIPLPAVLRTPLAWLIAKRREKAAQANYAIMGGGSPLLPGTQAQANALAEALATARPDLETRVFIAMRYWSPLSKETAQAVHDFTPDRVVLLPLYPQYSTATTASSLDAWTKVYKGSGRTDVVCCYPEEPGLVEAYAGKIRQALEAGGSPANVRLLFSAHGLPQKIIDGGDPYQSQIERTAAAVAARLGATDWQVCYQSRVGPMKWLGPSTPEAIAQAASEGKGVVLCPIAFVSEHVETLVELDHEYAELAQTLGCAPYLRAQTPGVADNFIDGLAAVTLASFDRGLAPAGPACDGCWSRCALKRKAA
jgi:protoporphyrin/coproporphyrin ferrochelatase